MLTTTIGTGGDAEASTFASAITRWPNGHTASIPAPGEIPSVESDGEEDENLDL